MTTANAAAATHFAAISAERPVSPGDIRRAAAAIVAQRAESAERMSAMAARVDSVVLAADLIMGRALPKLAVAQWCDDGRTIRAELEQDNGDANYVVELYRLEDLGWQCTVLRATREEPGVRLLDGDEIVEALASELLRAG